jgi:hypothetical protein
MLMPESAKLWSPNRKPEGYQMKVIAGVVLAAALAAGPAQAQFVVKRIRCADLAQPDLVDRHMVYQNENSHNTRIKIQIVRDGCRPKKSDGQAYIVLTNDSTSSSFRYFKRNGKSTSMIDETVPQAWVVYLLFRTVPSGQRVGGTLDYVVDAE